MAGWHHQLDRHEFEQTPGDGEGKPGVLQSMGSQRVRHDSVMEKQDCCWKLNFPVLQRCLQLQLWPLDCLLVYNDTTCSWALPQILISLIRQRR